jgi:predicted nucleic acid-binding protein
MILVDSSVWIRFFANRTPYADELGQLIGLDVVAGHDLVYGELHIGDCGGRNKQLSGYEHLHQARTLPHREVVEFVRVRGLYGRGLSWIDAHLLASAIAERLQLWTADERFAVAAAELGVAYSPQRPDVP